MHRPFSPVPLWLDPSKGVGTRDSLDFGTKKPGRTALEQALEFQLLCFAALYRLGLSDRQTAEVTTLILLLHNKEGRVARIQMTQDSVARWKAEHPGQDPFWYRDGFRFFWAFDGLDEFFEAWMTLNLPRTERFWLGAEDWVVPFLEGEATMDSFKKLTDKLRVLFAQHVLGLPVTGVWDRPTMAACKTFQEAFPKVMMPWRGGLLDGFTYRALARHWRLRQGIRG